MSSLLRGQFQQVEAVCELEQGTWYQARVSSGAPVDIAVLTRPTDAFREQLNAIGKARHPNLPELREVLELDGGALGAVFAAARGRSVDERIKQGNGTVAEAIDWACRVGEAIAVLHEAGVVHGDIEPSWVRLVPGRGPMLTGLVLNRSEGRKRGYGDDVANTLRYTPPEQLEGEVTEKGDIFSVGAVLYHALTGQAPFDAGDGESDPGTSVEALRQRILHGKVAPLAELRVDLRGVMAYAVDRALQSDPARRFPNAEAFRKALRSALVVAPMMGRRPLSAPPPVPEKGPKKPVSVVEDEAGEPVDPNSLELRSLPPPVPTSASAKRKRRSIPPVARAPLPVRALDSQANGGADLAASGASKTRVSPKPAVESRDLSAGRRSVDELDVPDAEPLGSPPEPETKQEAASPSPIPQERTRFARIESRQEASAEAAAASEEASAEAAAASEQASAEAGAASEREQPAAAEGNGAAKARRRRTASWMPPAPSKHRDAGGPPRGVVGGGSELEAEPAQREPTLRMAFGSDEADSSTKKQPRTRDTNPEISHRVGAFPAGVAQAFGHVETKPLPSLDASEEESIAKAVSEPNKASPKEATAKATEQQRTLAGYPAPAEEEPPTKNRGPRQGAAGERPEAPSLAALMAEDTDVEPDSSAKHEAQEGAEPLDPDALGLLEEIDDGQGSDDVEALIAQPTVPDARVPSQPAAAVSPPPMASPMGAVYEGGTIPTIRVRRPAAPRVPTWAAASAGALVGGVLVGVLYSAYTNPQRSEVGPSTDTQLAVNANQGAELDPNRPENGAIDPGPAPAEPTREAPRVVALRGLPPGAELLVDGELVEGNSILLDGAPHSVEVVAEGFAPWIARIGAEQEEFVVELTPVAEMPPDSVEPTAEPAATDEGPARETATETARETATTPAPETAARPTTARPSRPTLTPAQRQQRRAEAMLRAEARRLEALRRARTPRPTPPAGKQRGTSRRPSVVRDPGF